MVHLYILHRKVQRNTGEELLEFHAASFKLAEKSKCPIVPVALNNTDEVLEKHMPWITQSTCDH